MNNKTYLSIRKNSENSENIDNRILEKEKPKCEVNMDINKNTFQQPLNTKIAKINFKTIPTANSSLNSNLSNNEIKTNIECKIENHFLFF